jgi:uncharacterized protein YcfL
MKKLGSRIPAGILAALAAAPLAGCHKPTVDTVTIPAEGSYNWLNTDSKLARVATVTRVSKARAGDLLRVQVDITNNTADPQTVMYRITWLDDTGMTVDTPLTTWTRTYIQGRQSQSIGGVAPDARVKDAKMELILGDQ